MLSSEFDSFVKGFVAPFHAGQFAERTPTGQLDREAVVIRWRDGRSWKGSGVFGNEETVEQFDASGNLVQVYTRTVDLLFAELPEDVRRPPFSATVSGKGRDYSVAKTGHQTGDNFMRLALVDERLVQDKPMQNRG